MANIIIIIIMTTTNSTGIVPCKWTVLVHAIGQTLHQLIEQLRKLYSLTAVPLTHSLQGTVTAEQHKHQDLSFEIKQHWQLNQIIVIPLVLSATGSSLTCLTRASPPSVYRHTYCARCRKYFNKHLFPCEKIPQCPSV